MGRLDFNYFRLAVISLLPIGTAVYYTLNPADGIINPFTLSYIFTPPVIIVFIIFTIKLNNLITTQSKKHYIIFFMNKETFWLFLRLNKQKAGHEQLLPKHPFQL
jgi:hypothetical protein